jgi:hypothetical protein
MAAQFIVLIGSTLTKKASFATLPVVSTCVLSISLISVNLLIQSGNKCECVMQKTLSDIDLLSLPFYNHSSHPSVDMQRTVTLPAALLSRRPCP